ncbi:MAG: TetR/AcrR family transcriptional regulator [Solirubrobacterales bacterium]|nr:TetR/AcrR family transcriptional regulator [Solirubrobacterales bacterium]
MTKTPWGDSEELRARKLTPGHRLPAAEVARSQRERLLAAVVATVAEQGYERTSVADIVEASGVSRTAFYRHFSNKEECFVAAVDGTLEIAMAAIGEAYRTEGGWDARLVRAFETYVNEIMAQPAAAQICLIDTFAAGPAAIERVNRGGAQFERMLRQSFAQSPLHAGLPPLVVRGIVGGVRNVVATRLRVGQADTLGELAPGLGAWTLTYRAPSTPIRRPRVQPAAPGAARPDANDQMARIFAALDSVVREKGYLATTLDDVADRSAISFSTYYNYFSTKEEAFLAAYDQGIAQAYAASAPPFQRAPDWPHGVRAALEGLLTYLAREPDWAYSAVVEVLAVGAPGIARRDAAIEKFTRMLEPGFEEAPDLAPVAREAIGGAIFETLYNRIRERDSRKLLDLLPTVTFLALAPFIGADAAVAVANERAPRRVAHSRAS